MDLKKLAEAAAIQQQIKQEEEMLCFLAEHSDAKVEVAIGGRTFEIGNPVLRVRILSGVIDRVGANLEAARAKGEAL